MRLAVLSGGRRTVSVLAVLLGLHTVAAPAAAAHTELAGSAPRAGASVQRLGEVRLQFRSPLQPGDPQAIRLLGPEDARWDDGDTRVVSGRELVVGVAPALARAGEYTVRWCATTTDGHRQSGAYLFSYTGPADAAARPLTPAAGPGTDTADCAAVPAGAGATLTRWLLLGLFAGAILFLAVAALLGSRRSGPRHTGG